jgi:predicted enzyme related to lactoylglutathione lyase
MEAKVASVSIVVTNQTKALEFYTNQVGFEKKADVAGPGGYRWLTVGPKGQELELVLFEMGSTVDPSQKDASQHWAPGRAPPIQVRVSDCKKAYEELTEKGVKFPQPLAEHPWGTVATFTDPDGNLFSLSQLKSW